MLCEATLEISSLQDSYCVRASQKMVPLYLKDVESWLKPFAPRLWAIRKNFKNENSWSWSGARMGLFNKRKEWANFLIEKILVSDVIKCGCIACRIWDLSSLTGIEPTLPAVEVQSLNYWTTKEVPFWQFWCLFVCMFPIGKCSDRSFLWWPYQ